MKIAIQGAAGSFHHSAAEKYFGNLQTEPLEYVYGDTYAAVFTALAAGLADTALIDIENSLYGSIPEVYTLLAKYKFPIVGEIVDQIHHNLISLPGAKTEDIALIYSHPVALAQCAHYLASHFPKAEIIQYYDTAGAVEHVKRSGQKSYAAIAGGAAAELHGMYILERQIEDEPHNYARFLAIEPDASPPAGANKASLLLVIPDAAGSLHRALGIFADLGSNITKLRSRPIPGKILAYQFYVDVQISPTDLAVAIEMLARQQCAVTNLGAYKAADTFYEG